MASAESGESGQTILGALHNKYDQLEEQAEELEFVIFVPKSAPGKKDGGELVVPQDLYLNKCNITHAGDERELKSVCRSVSELHLADNNIESWEEVQKILNCFPCLSALNLNNNRMGSTPIPDNWSQTYPNLRVLIVNYLLLPWDSVCKLLHMFPNLQEIHLSFNNYSTVLLEPFNGATFQSVETLNLNGNPFTRWDDIAKIGTLFPKLKVLHMLDVPLEDFPETSDDIASGFPCLQEISVMNCPIRAWAQLETFRHIPNLTAIKLLGDIPVLQDLEEVIRRQLILGYLPGLKRLNGGQVSVTERENAERAFIRYYMDREESERPQRVAELVEIHGMLQPLPDVDLSASNLTVSLVVKGGGDSPSRVTIARQHWTVARLKRELMYFTYNFALNGHVPPSGFDLAYRKNGVEEILDEQLKVEDYNFSDGTEIYALMKTQSAKRAKTEDSKVSGSVVSIADEKKPGMQVESAEKSEPEDPSIPNSLLQALIKKNPRCVRWTVWERKIYLDTMSPSELAELKLIEKELLEAKDKKVEKPADREEQTSQNQAIPKTSQQDEKESSAKSDQNDEESRLLNALIKKYPSLVHSGRYEQKLFLDTRKPEEIEELKKSLNASTQVENSGNATETAAASADVTAEEVAEIPDDVKAELLKRYPRLENASNLEMWQFMNVVGIRDHGEIKKTFEVSDRGDNAASEVSEPNTEKTNPT